MKKITSYIFAFLFALTAIVTPNAGAISYNIDFELNSETVYMVNADTGAEIFTHNADVKRYPASTTKIMTYIVVVENVKDLMNTKAEIKYDIIHALDGTGSSVAGLEEYIGKTLSIYDLLCCLMIKSGNDAALVLADFVSNGNQDEFIKLMNKKVAELKCTATNFTNPHGLHDENQYTTAKDMYKIVEYAQGLPYFMEICGMASYYLPESDYPLVTTNSLIDPGRGGDYYYQYATGIKTGTTDEAGYSLVASATKDGYSYICIAFKAPCLNEDGSWREDNGAMYDCVNMFKWAFNELEIKTLLNKETPVCNIKLESAWNKDMLILVPEKNFSTILHYSIDASSVDIIPNIPESVEAPVKKGDVIGTATISYANEELAVINLVASETVGRSEVVKVTNSVKGAALSWWVIIPVSLVVILFIAYIVLATIYTKRMERQKRERNNYK